jgi:uncharacterized protein (TIGR00645 family)
MERIIERAILGLRWMLLPLYLALFAALVPIYGLVFREIFHLFADIATMNDIDLVLILCAVLDLVLVANLILMVAVSSYESFVSRISPPPDGASPEWLGKLDAGDVKVKVAISVTMISMIHLLRAFMKEDNTQYMMALAGVHLVFVGSAIAMAFIARMSHAKPAA